MLYNKIQEVISSNQDKTPIKDICSLKMDKFSSDLKT